MVDIVYGNAERDVNRYPSALACPSAIMVFLDREGSDSPDRSSPAGGDDMTGFLYVGCYEAEAAYDPFSYLSQMDSMTLTVRHKHCRL